MGMPLPTLGKRLPMSIHELNRKDAKDAKDFWSQCLSWRVLRLERSGRLICSEWENSE